MMVPPPIPEQYKIPNRPVCSCCGERTDGKLKFHGEAVCGVRCLSHLAAGKEHR
jgi:hypothetical protein